MRQVDKKTWILTGIMFVVVFLLTWLLRVDIPYGETAKAAGYWTLGDVGIYVAVMLLGGPLGALASGLGACLADIVAGHASYAIATLIIKAVMALLIGWHLKRGTSLIHRVKTVCLAGGMMTLLYFLYDLVVRGNYLVAAIGLPFNVLQAIACGIIAVLVLFLTRGKSYHRDDSLASSQSSSKRALK